MSRFILNNIKCTIPLLYIIPQAVTHLYIASYMYIDYRCTIQTVMIAYTAKRAVNIVKVISTRYALL